MSLAAVRHCPKCNKFVAEQHTKCLYCGTSFIHDPLEGLSPTELPVNRNPFGLSRRAVRQLRAASVSILTFVVVFCLGAVFLAQENKASAPVRVIAKSSVLHRADLRRNPSMDSAIIGNAAPGTSVSLTGFLGGERDRWVTLNWNNEVVYAPASDLTAPLAVDADEGANVLKFYLSGLQGSESVEAATKAVDYYAKTFPENPRRNELRFILAERVKALSLDGSPRSKHSAAAKGQKTRDVLAHKPARKADEPVSVDDSGTRAASQPWSIAVE